MGLTIRSKNHSIDIGTGGFLRLRKTIADLTNKEISEHYGVLLTEEYIHTGSRHTTERQKSCTKNIRGSTAR